MAIPLWDDIPIPPGHTLVDINGLTPESLKLQRQGDALTLWIDETGEPFAERDWNDDEGIFVIVEDATGEHIGIQIIVDVEDA